MWDYSLNQIYRTESCLKNDRSGNCLKQEHNLHDKIRGEAKLVGSSSKYI